MNRWEYMDMLLPGVRVCAEERGMPADDIRLLDDDRGLWLWHGDRSARIFPGGWHAVPREELNERAAIRIKAALDGVREGK